MSRYTLFFSLCVVLILSSCTRLPAPVESVQPDIRASVAAWDSGVAELSAMFYAAEEAPVVTGKLSENGQFEVMLAQSVPASLLELVPSCEGLVVSNAEAKTNQFSALYASRDSEKLALVAKASSRSVMLNGLRTAGDFYVQFIYADQAVTMVGDCALAGVPGVFRYDLDLKAGWNETAFGFASESASGIKTLELSNKEPLSNAAWFYSE